MSRLFEITGFVIVSIAILFAGMVSWIAYLVNETDVSKAKIYADKPEAQIIAACLKSDRTWQDGKCVNYQPIPLRW